MFNDVSMLKILSPWFFPDSKVIPFQAHDLNGQIELETWMGVGAAKPKEKSVAMMGLGKPQLLNLGMALLKLSCWNLVVDLIYLIYTQKKALATFQKQSF